MLRTLGICLAVLAFLLSPIGQPPLSAEAQPVLIVTVSSVNNLLSDVGYLAEATGTGQYGQMAGAIAQGYIQGLDHDRPIAIVVQSDGDEIKPLGILPVKDLDQFLAGLAQQLGEPQDAGDGILELAGPAPMFVKEQNGWAYIASSATDLSDLPDDPATMMRGMPQKYDVGIRGFVQNIPQVYRDMALAQIKEGVQAQMDALPADEDSELQRKLVENQIRQWEAIFNEVEQIQLGWSTDQENQKLVLDSTVVAVPGTNTARQMTAIRDTKTSFGGFYNDEAAVGVRQSGRIQPRDVDQALAMLSPMRDKVMDKLDESDEIPSEAAREVVKSLAGSLLDVLEATLKEGIADGALTIDMDGKSMTLVGGMHVAEGGKIEETLKELDSLADSNPDFKIEFNVDQHAGVRFHQVAIPIDDDHEVREVFGDALAITVGVSQSSVYFGLGQDAIAEVMKAMDASQVDQSVKPAEMYLSLGKIMAFAAQVSDEPVVDAIAAELVDAGESDRVVMTVDPVENGAEYHFEIRDGILKAIGAGVKAKQAEAVGAGG